MNHDCVSDNDGTCHWCGEILNHDWYEHEYGHGHQMKPITFTIPGKPQQRGSKSVGVRYDRSGQPVTKNGRVLTFARDSNENSKEWMSLVRDKAVDAMRGVLMFDGPVILTAKFFFLRPQTHFGTGRNAGVLKASAPAEYAQAPDLSKLLRCIEDGLSELVFRDDRQIVRYGVGTGKYWTTDMPRAEVVVEEVEMVDSERKQAERPAER